MAINAVYEANIGMVKVVASTLVHTRNLKGLVPDTSMASICSVTRIDPSSAPILEPTLPEAIRAVTNGASARRIAMDTSEGSHEVAPNEANDGRDCLVKITPTIKPVNDIKVKDRTPTSKHWRITSLNSKGGTNASRKNRRMNAFILVILTKKFASRCTKLERFFFTGVDGLSVLSISGDKGIIYQWMNHAVLQKTYECCLKMIFHKHFQTTFILNNEASWF